MDNNQIDCADHEISLESASDRFGQSLNWDDYESVLGYAFDRFEQFVIDELLINGSIDDTKFSGIYASLEDEVNKNYLRDKQEILDVLDCPRTICQSLAEKISNNTAALKYLRETKKLPIHFFE